ncbi:MAG TPA: DUF6428 family protein [Abditibacterium sp.]|jgi:hypothetical protein
MTLQEFKNLLHNHRETLFQLRLPHGDAVPVSFHITEVGRVEKTFLDCGGKLHTRKTCQLQVWVGPDEDHRIQAGKMADILDQSEVVVPDDSLELELEYEREDGFVSQFPVSHFEVSDQAVTLHLGVRHTECLAPELCIVPAPSPGSFSLPMIVTGGGCGPTGCC